MTTTITRETHRRISADILAALTAIEAKHNIKFTQGKSHFDSSGGTGDMLLKFALVQSDGKVAMDPTTAWAMKHYGLTDELCIWPGKPGGWRIAGYNSRAPKYPFSVVNDFGGQGYRIPLATAQRYFGLTTRVPKNPPVIKAPVAAPSAPQAPQRQYASQF